jgi:ABC-2 type transport system ATP-binding protein
MKRKLDLAMTLVGDPKVIFLDEPTTGLDPRSRRTMWEIIRELVAEGTTILLTTQYLDEADQLADRVAVLDGGRIVAEGTPAELKARIPGGHVELSFASRAEFDAAALALAPTGRDDDALTLQLPGDGSVGSLRALLRRLDDASVTPEALTVHTPDLDDVFFGLTGKKGA